MDGRAFRRTAGRGHNGPVDGAETSGPSRSEPGADFLQLDMAAAPPRGLSGYLAEQLRRAIADGRLPVGGRVPPGRLIRINGRFMRSG